VEIIKRSDKAEGFVLLPRRWVVERMFAGLAVPPFGKRLGENSRKFNCMGNGGEHPVPDQENRKTLRSKINF
jgi:hypothetical protein